MYIEDTMLGGFAPSPLQLMLEAEDEYSESDELDSVYSAGTHRTATVEVEKYESS